MNCNAIQFMAKPIHEPKVQFMPQAIHDAKHQFIYIKERRTHSGTTLFTFEHIFAKIILCSAYIFILYY